MEEPRCAMVYLAWIASEVASATGLPKNPMITQKPQSGQGREGWVSGGMGREEWMDAAYSIRRTALRE
jgi:hypothetical protein